MTYGARTIDERFADVDPATWTTSYLPAWSSRSEAAATWEVDDEGLRLSIAPAHPVWCEGDHEPALRVSGVQSGNWSGPVGSTRGQQPFRDGQVVREEQPACWGFTPEGGRVEVTCRAVIGPGSMFSAWMVGVEDEPERSGEICLVEVFGDSIRDGTDGPTAEVGCGIHPFRDPAMREEFNADRRAIDVSVAHTYGIEWTATGVSFVDGTLMKSTAQSPRYPMQLILAVFEFPGQVRDGSVEVPELVVSRVLGSRLDASSH